MVVAKIRSWPHEQFVERLAFGWRSAKKAGASCSTISRRHWRASVDPAKFAPGQSPAKRDLLFSASFASPPRPLRFKLLSCLYPRPQETRKPKPETSSMIVGIPPEAPRELERHN